MATKIRPDRPGRAFGGAGGRPFLIPVLILSGWLSACQTTPALIDGSSTESSPNASAEAAPPDWLAQPPADTPTHFYASAQAKTREAALEQALAMVVRKVAVTVTSQFESRQEVWQGAFDWQRQHSEQTLHLQTPTLTVTGHKVIDAQTRPNGTVALLVEVHRRDWYQSLSSDHQALKQAWSNQVRPPSDVTNLEQWLKQVPVRLSVRAQLAQWWQRSQYLAAISPAHDPALDHAFVQTWQADTQALLAQRPLPVMALGEAAPALQSTLRRSLDSALSNLNIQSRWLEHRPVHPPASSDALAGLVVETRQSQTQAQGFEIHKLIVTLNWQTAQQTLATHSLTLSGRGLAGRHQAINALQKRLRETLARPSALQPLWSAAFEH
ncbi:MAG: LPP20 family lipoprotein [Hydrogenovibrio sp.]|uniref:LPP20 family lipoprotein n=1 Tax=Hydrogenovibrio sp. TaxID=2065821 RepID=UPI0028700CBE|nr:LPP20 family lipoprotein [Hydrogenovibrio sp.]MDR9498188.1 LPP20 family lipoprotein [Hydrogenovibrio sp.]